jgi:2'-5' RNA ligase
MFVALDLPEDARAAIAAWRDELLSGRPELRAVAVEALHVTLAFLGWQDEAAAGEIAAASFAAAGGIEAPVLRPVAIKSVPPRRPRLFALDLEDEDGRATALQAAVAAALEAGGFYRPEKRPFWPHITLARGDGSRGLAPPDPRGDWRGGGSPVGLAPFRADPLTLYRSTLRPQGALYEPLAGLHFHDE